MGTIRNMLYDSSDINQAARDRAEMLSVRPSPGDDYHKLRRNGKAAHNGAIFCLVMVALLLVTWRFWL